MVNYLNDDYLTYNLAEHRYQPSDLLLNDAGIYLDSYFKDENQTEGIELAKERWRTRLSRTLYTVLWEYGKNLQDTQLYLSQQHLRIYIIAALQMLAEAWVINRFDPGIVLSAEKPVDIIPPILKAYIISTRLAFTSYLSIQIKNESVYGVDY